MNKIATALNFLDDELLVSALESMETESKTANGSMANKKPNTFKLYPKRWITAFVSLLLVVCLTPIVYFLLPKDSGAPGDPQPDFFMLIELPKTQCGVDDTVFVNISVGLYDWSGSIASGDADLSLPEGWNWIVMIHEHERWDDYSNATILAVLDFPPEPLNKYGYTKVNGEIVYNYHEDFSLPSSYFSESEGQFAISLIETNSDLDDLPNLTYSSCITQIFEYTKNEDGIALSHYKEK